MSTTLSSSIASSAKSAINEELFIVYKVGSAPVIYRQFLLKMFIEMIPAISMIILISAIRFLVDLHTLMNFLEAYCIACCIYNILPVTLVQATGFNIERHLECLQWKAIKVFTTYSFVIVELVMIIQFVIAEFAVKTLTMNSFFIGDGVQPMYTTIVSLAFVTINQFEVQKLFLDIEQRTMYLIATSILQSVIILLLIFGVQFLSKSLLLEFTNSTYMLIFGVIIVAGFAVPNVPTMLQQIRQISIKLHVTHACAVDFRYFRPFREKPFQLIFKRFPLFFLQNFTYRVAVIIPIYLSNNVFKINEEQAQQMTVGCCSYFLCGEILGAISRATYQIFRQVFRMNMNARIQRMAPNLALYILATSIVLSVIYYCIHPLLLHCVFNDPTYEKFLDPTKWCVLRGILMPLMSIALAFSQTKNNKWIFALTQLTFIISLVVALLICFCGRQQRFIWGTILCNLIENVGSLLCFILTYKAIRKLMQTQKIDIIAEMQKQDDEKNNKKKLDLKQLEDVADDDIDFDALEIEEIKFKGNDDMDEDDVMGMEGNEVSDPIFGTVPESDNLGGHTQQNSSEPVVFGETILQVETTTSQDPNFRRNEDSTLFVVRDQGDDKRSTLERHDNPSSVQSGQLESSQVPLCPEGPILHQENIVDIPKADSSNNCGLKETSMNEDERDVGEGEEATVNLIQTHTNMDI